jgi:hypothetical protein
MLPETLKPYHVLLNNLERLGDKSDGGYVIHKKSIKQTQVLVSIGLGENWSFEKELIKQNNKIKILMFDHTVNNYFFFKKFFKDILHFFLLKKLRLKKLMNIFLYFDYLFFFKKKNVSHIKKKVGNRNVDGQISITKILKNLINKKTVSVFLKVDIEGDEYSLLNDIQRFEHSINSLIIEFHQINENNNLKKILSFVKKLKLLKIIHVHGNNIYLKKNVHDIIEITFANAKYLSFEKFKSKRSYPISQLDYPNHPRKIDKKLRFF